MAKISTITRKYRREEKLTQEQLGGLLFDDIPGVDGKSKQTISNWENDKDQPLYQDVVLVFLWYRDWRYEWAREVLAVLKPNIWGKGVEIYMPVFESEIA